MDDQQPQTQPSVPELLMAFSDVVRQLAQALAGGVATMSDKDVVDKINVWVKTEFDAELKDIRDQFEGLEEWKDGVESSVSDAEDKAGDAKSDVEDIVDRVDNAIATVEAIEAKIEYVDFDDIETANSNAEEAKEAVEEVKEDVTKMSSDLDDLGITVEAHTKEIAVVSDRMDVVEHRVSAFFDTLAMMAVNAGGRLPVAVTQQQAPHVEPSATDGSDGV